MTKHPVKTVETTEEWPLQNDGNSSNPQKYSIKIETDTRKSEKKGSIL
jgi:hypothetical protein